MTRERARRERLGYLRAYMRQVREGRASFYFEGRGGGLALTWTADSWMVTRMGYDPCVVPWLDACDLVRIWFRSLRLTVADGVIAT